MTLLTKPARADYFSFKRLLTSTLEPVFTVNQLFHESLFNCQIISMQGVEQPGVLSAKIWLTHSSIMRWSPLTIFMLYATSSTARVVAAAGT
jgi:hypothetical protein